MRTIPFITSDLDLYQRVEQLKASTASLQADMVWINDPVDGLEFLDVEMPDLAFINFSDQAMDGFALLDDILKDPWLHYASIVGFCDDFDTCERLEKVQAANIIVGLGYDDVEKYLPKILGIIAQNQRILFQRGISADLLQSLSGAFHLHNDTIEANCYANLLCNFLFNANKIDGSGKMHINIALTEMLINGIEHGNCGISYGEKSAWLEEGNMMRDLIAKKCEDPAVRSKRVLFEYAITPTKSTFVITDEGPGFDWRALKEPSKSENVQALHGRGIKMTRKYTKNLTFNEKGNQVTFEIEHQADCANAQPALFEKMAPLTVRPGDIVFREGEPGDFLFYIVKGRYNVMTNSKVIATLTPDDILMGEMAFLLNNRRTATVEALSEGTLIRMSKKDFVEAIKSKPHYGLMLARLLADRILRKRGQSSSE